MSGFFFLRCPLVAEWRAESAALCTIIVLMQFWLFQVHINIVMEQAALGIKLCNSQVQDGTVGLYYSNLKVKLRSCRLEFLQIIDHS